MAQLYCHFAVRIAASQFGAQRQAGIAVATFSLKTIGQKIKFSGLSSVSGLSNALKLLELIFGTFKKTDLSYAQLVRFSHVAACPTTRKWIVKRRDYYACRCFGAAVWAVNLCGDFPYLRSMVDPIAL